MTILHWVSVGSGMLSALAAFVGAWYWFQSARVRTDPEWSQVVGDGLRVMPPKDQGFEGDSDSITALSSGLSKAAGLNKKAAVWSGIAAILGGLAVASGAFAG